MVDEMNDELTEEEMIIENNYLTNCLIELLIEKGVITEDEYQKKLDQGLSED